MRNLSLTILLLSCSLHYSTLLAQEATAEVKQPALQETQAIETNSNNQAVLEPSVYGKGLTISLDESGSKYIRFIMWHQLWLSGGSQQDGLSFSIRRSRVLAVSQFTPRFLVLTHFGLNSLSAEGLTGNPNTQQSNKSDIFLHGAWGEYMIKENHFYVGAGLHYWNGISRLASQSTLNMMTLDNPGAGLADAKLFPWANITTSDQFARSMGFYVKGTIGNFAYRASANNSRKNLGVLDPVIPSFQVNGNGKDWNYQAYASINLLDPESDKLPYFVGTYLGKKRVLNIGAGFHYQPNAIKTSVESTVSNSFASEESLARFAADLFYDSPVGISGAALNFYGAYYRNQYGSNEAFSSGGLVPGTGDIYYGQVGFLLPNQKKSTHQFMPYATYSLQDIKNTPNLSNEFGLGINWYISGHNAKITYEYNTGLKGTENANRQNLSRLQLHFFI